MKPGDLASIVPQWTVMHGLDTGRKSYTSYPGEYGHHKTIMVYSEDIGIVLEIRGEFTRILVRGQSLWINSKDIECKTSFRYDTV